MSIRKGLGDSGLTLGLGDGALSVLMSRYGLRLCAGR